MCEITTKNFDDVLPELEEALKQSRFISIDTEFSCLNASRKMQNSLFDSGNERYAKLRMTVEQMIPVQIGITAYIFNPDRNLYMAHIYTFYVFPRTFAFIDKKFLCQASSFQFLSSHKFDFNKLVKEGISYLNRSQEEELLTKSDNISFVDSSMAHDIEHILEDNAEVINKWIHNAKIDDELILTNISMYENNLDMLYFLHKEIRQRFKHIWTFEDKEGFKIQKLTPQHYENITKEYDLDQIFISRLLGFTKIFRLLTSLQKPIIGHNLILDLMVMVHNFEKPLPKSYMNFKKLVHTLFPVIYDTKCMSFDISKSIPESKRWSQNTLPSLYEYFKDGHGRHLALNSPLIEPTSGGQETFHYAGWDSYCTGYIFIRMAHIIAAQRCNVRNKKFMSTELLQAITQFKNSINIIRGDVSHIQLDGNDPISKRPPWLIIETKNKPININQITCLLSTYGFVEVKPHSFKGHRAIIAVDNFGSARRILRQFQSHSDFKIQPYSTLKHSLIARACLWSGIAASGVFLTWYGYSKIK